MTNTLKDYLVKRGESGQAFSKRSGIALATVYKVLNGGKCRIDVAKKIVRYTKKAVMLKDLGYD